jgi:hypothetical protein
MYAATVPVLTRMLTNLSAVLEKAEHYASERDFDVDVLVGSRLAPDMRPLSFQIQSATDRAKFAVARLTGRTPPSWPDDETTFADLKARIGKALAYLGEFAEADFEGTDEKQIPIRVRGADTMMAGQDYLLANAYPHFYFHVTTAYDILRHNGVPIGKRDFTGCAWRSAGRIGTARALANASLSPIG